MCNVTFCLLCGTIFPTDRKTEFRSNVFFKWYQKNPEKKSQKYKKIICTIKTSSLRKWAKHRESP